MFIFYDNPISHLVDFTRYTFLSGRFYQMIWYDRAGYLVDSTRLSGSSGQVNRLKKSAFSPLDTWLYSDFAFGGVFS